MSHRRFNHYKEISLTTLSTFLYFFFYSVLFVTVGSLVLLVTVRLIVNVLDYLIPIDLYSAIISAFGLTIKDMCLFAGYSLGFGLAAYLVHDDKSLRNGFTIASNFFIVLFTLLAIIFYENVATQMDKATVGFILIIMSPSIGGIGWRLQNHFRRKRKYSA